MYKSEWVEASENLLLKKSLVESQMERLQLLKLMSCRNITEVQLSIMHRIWRVCKMSFKLVYTIIRRQTEDLTTADVQRVHHHGAVLIKENESDRRESISAIQKIREATLCNETR